MSFINHNNVSSIVKKLGQIISKYNIFIESGTFGGETIVNLRNSFQTLYTIELSEKYYQYFDEIRNREKYYNIQNLFGDTVEVLPKILDSLKETDRVIFWLDGHWSSLDTAKGEKDCPVIDECISIDQIYKSDEAIILIDDYRLFGTFIAEDWLDVTEENILKCFKNFKIVQHFVEEDILVLRIKK
jgi:hypothetical protein